MPLLGDTEENITPSVQGDVFVIQQTLNLQVKLEIND